MSLAKVLWTRSLLRAQSAATSSALIEQYLSHPDFLRLAAYEQKLTVQRDDEDGEKLQAGIDLAKSRGVIDPHYCPQPYTQLDVLGKTPHQVAEEIWNQTTTATTTTTNEPSNQSSTAGFVIVLCGLSGTGKGTTVSILRQKLEQDHGKNVVTWSNGNIFRAVTLLAATWWEQRNQNQQDDASNNGTTLPAASQPALVDPAIVLTKDNVATFMDMLSFVQHPTTGQYDTHISGLGWNVYVSDVQNTILKSPKVSQNIPTVAEFTQGEVILFAAKAIDTLVQHDPNLVVLLEGREQTVNYVRSPYRFTLILSDESLIGKRRAAQRVMAAALYHLPDNENDNDTDSNSDEESTAVLHALDQALQQVVNEM